MSAANKKWSSHILFSDLLYNIDPTILKVLIERGPDFLMERFRTTMNEVLKLLERGSVKDFLSLF